MDRLPRCLRARQGDNRPVARPDRIAGGRPVGGLIARARDSVPRPAPTSWRATLHDEAEAFSVSIS